MIKLRLTQRRQVAKGNSYQRKGNARIIADLAFKIHTTVGPGLPESVYESVFFYQLTKRGLKVLGGVSNPMDPYFAASRETLPGGLINPTDPARTVFP